MQLDEQRLRFRDAMASLSAAVNVITTEGEAGRCGITATAVCSVTDSPPSVMVCINANSAMNPVFQGNGKLCINVLNHEQEVMARHFAGMTGMAMEDRFNLSCWQKGAQGQPVLKGSLASLHLVYLVEIKNITLSQQGHGLIYFKRRFHPVMMEMEVVA